MSWLVKRRHYDGGESVVNSAHTKEGAQAIADGYNTAYQSHTFYAEEYDPAKVEWPATLPFPKPDGPAPPIPRYMVVDEDGYPEFMHDDKVECQKYADALLDRPTSHTYTVEEVDP